MQEKGCVFVQRVYYSTTILKIFGATRQFSAILFKKGYISAKFARKTACFLPKNCNRKGVFFQKIATERVQFRRPRWHTRVQKLGKCPPPGFYYQYGIMNHVFSSLMEKVIVLEASKAVKDNILL